MAQSLLMKQGLEGLFNPEKKFESEAEYGKKILYVAWAVEILAAIIGLTIAAATAYDAYRGIENPDTSHLINALIGALPFLIIAVIEPTKIPLAGGFYKTRALGWKILILCALLGLTGVTFETMFNGLERNLTNVTRKVVDAENQIQFLGDQLDEKVRKLAELENTSETSVTSDLSTELEAQTATFNEFVESENNSLNEQIKPILEMKRSLQNSFAQLAGEAGETSRSQIDVIAKNIEAMERQIISLEAARDGEIENYVNGLNASNASEENQNQSRIDGINQQKAQKQNEIEKRRAETETAKQSLANSITVSNAELNQTIQSLLAQQESEKKGKIFTGKIDKKYADLVANAQTSHKEKVNTLTQSFETASSSNLKRIELLQSEISELDKQVVELLSENKTPLLAPDQNKIEKIRENASRKIDRIRQDIQKAQDQMTQITNAQSGASKRQRESLQAQIEQYDRQIDEMTQRSNARVEERKARFVEEQQKLDAQKQSRISAISTEKEQIQPLRAEITELQSKIDENKKIKREASYDSQVFRLAALAYGKTDVADVTREEIKVVSVIWFGSIALIVSTIGTVLALISYILRDPEAFVERKKFSLTRRVNRVFYLIFWRMNQVLLSGIKLLSAIIRLVLSFAEIFRGLIGKPVQRSIRLAMLAYRKKANKPRIQVVEKEIEKIVEVEVPKEVEVEKIVEKIVEVEVPVEKVAITEVPVEIVRKELVYVPLYSTDSGLIDASTELKGAKPKIDPETRDTNDATASNFQSGAPKAATKKQTTRKKKRQT